MSRITDKYCDLRDNPAYTVRPRVSSGNRGVEVGHNYEIVEENGHVTAASHHVTGHVGAPDISEIQEPTTHDVYSRLQHK